MSKVLKTEQEVKDALGIKDWRNLSKDKVIEFISLLPNIDREIAIKIIDSFPKFTTLSTKMITTLKDLCGIALKGNNDVSKQVVEAYMKILDELSILVKEKI